MSSFRECCIAKYYLRPNDSAVYVVHRSNAALVALSAFLDVSSLNLAVPQGAAFFPAHRPGTAVRFEHCATYVLALVIACFPCAHKGRSYGEDAP
jgi:hypothetical protein